MTAHDKRISKTFDPIRHLGRQRTFEQYLAKVSGTKQQRTASYIAWRQRIFKAKRRANRHGHSAGRWKRDKAAILASRTATQIKNDKRVSASIREWAWKKLARRNDVSVQEMKEAALHPLIVSRKPTAEEWKPVPAHLRAKRPKPTQQHSQPIPAHPNNMQSWRQDQTKLTRVQTNDNRPSTAPQSTSTHTSKMQKKQLEKDKQQKQLEEEEQLLDGAIGRAEDKRTALAKSDDNPCPFKHSVDTRDVL